LYLETWKTWWSRVPIKALVANSVLFNLSSRTDLLGQWKLEAT
jgi:hypothetical protein